MDDKLKLKYEKWEQRQETKFVKAERKYGDSYMRQWVEKYPDLKGSYRNYILSVQETHRDLWTALFCLLGGSVFVVLTIFAGVSAIGAGLLWGIGIINLMTTNTSHLKEQMLLTDFFNEIKFHEYDVIFEVVKKAVKRVERNKDGQETNES